MYYNSPALFLKCVGVHGVAVKETTPWQPVVVVVVEDVGVLRPPSSSNLTDPYSPVEVCLHCAYASEHIAPNNKVHCRRLHDPASWQPGMATHTGIASVSYMWVCVVMTVEP